VSRSSRTGIAAAAALSGLAAAAIGSAADRRPVPPLPALAAADGVLADLPRLTSRPDAAGWRAARNAEAARGALTAHLTRPAVLRAGPGGAEVAHLERRTGYGAKRVFAVGALRPGWVGVRSFQRPNGRLGWIPASALRLEPVHTTLVADLSDRELTIRVDGRVRHRAPLGIGRPGHETPLGRFGVTDRLEGGPGAGAAYGCCVIPLTGHQTKLPAGWTGGTRIALHGTPSPGSVGQEVSAGCLRMRDEDIRRILSAVPLGATLTVRS